MSLQNLMIVHFELIELVRIFSGNTSAYKLYFPLNEQIIIPPSKKLNWHIYFRTVVMT